MEIIKRMAKKAQCLRGEKIPTVAFFGDSVTQGCFELYQKNESEIETYFDKTCAYHNYFAKICGVLFPNVPITIINAGISGDSATGGIERLERDVISYRPDLTVVCFGLDDSMSGAERIDAYEKNLRQIFTRLRDCGSEVIYMTANMMNTKLSCHLTGGTELTIAQKSMKIQTEGVLEQFFEAGKRAAAECGAAVCDVYAKWKRMAEYGVDTTELLANKINHPSRDLNWLFAFSLIDTMMQ